MARFVKGDIVVVPFPFSDLSQAKRRPALVVATLPGDDLILCQITGQTKKDSFAIALSSADILDGNLKKQSYIRPNRLFTCDSSIILYRFGSLSAPLMATVTEKLIELLTR